MGVAGYACLLSTESNVTIRSLSRTVLERTAKESDSLVREKSPNVRMYIPKYRRAREILRESVQTIG